MREISDAAEFLQWTAVLMATGALISGAQVLSGYRLFSRGGLLDWHTVRMRKRSRRTPWLLLGCLERDAPVVALLAFLKCISAVALSFAALLDRPMFLSLLALCTTTLLLAARGAVCTTADRVLNIVPLVLLATEMAADPKADDASLVFLATVGSLAYLTAGFTKLRRQEWRDGTYLHSLWANRVWGSPRLLRWTASARYLPMAAGWCVILFEVLLPLSLFGGTRLATASLAIGVLFHFALALSMGLNLFVWAFLSIYPALYFVAMGRWWS